MHVSKAIGSHAQSIGTLQLAGNHTYISHVNLTFGTHVHRPHELHLATRHGHDGRDGSKLYQSATYEIIGGNGVFHDARGFLSGVSDLEVVDHSKPLKIKGHWDVAGVILVQRKNDIAKQQQQTVTEVSEN